MDFGRLGSFELSQVDFTLPADGQQTDKTFSRLHGFNETRFHLGLPKWEIDTWKGILIPENSKVSVYASEYSRHFNSIELNATFYSIPKVHMMQKWADAVNENGDFLFCPKVSNIITHKKRLVDVEQDMEDFLEGISAFGQMLGPIFIQMSDNFGSKYYLQLETFLRRLPNNHRFFLELRHEDWFNDPIVRRQIFSLLSELNIGAVITDTAGRRDVLHMELPIPEVFIRFVGNGRGRTNEDHTRIDSWVSRLKQWQQRGLEKVYFFIHQLEVGYSVEMKDGEISGGGMSITLSDGRVTLPLADYTIKQFNQHLNANIPELVFL